MKPITTPAQLSYESFSYKRYITNLTEGEFDEARNAVMAMYTGVFELWGKLGKDIRNAKRQECFSLLIAWYLADMYPTRLTGGMWGTGGALLAGKSIKSVQLQFRSLNLPSEYDVLGSNQFGMKAANMIRYAPEMMGVYG